MMISECEIYASSRNSGSFEEVTFGWDCLKNLASEIVNESTGYGMRPIHASKLADANWSIIVRVRGPLPGC